MSYSRVTRRRLCAAITTVLAVTLCVGALSAPASASPRTTAAVGGASPASAADDVTLVRHTVPSVVDLSTKTNVEMNWELRGAGWATVVLRHQRTGITTEHLLGDAGAPGTFTLFWDAHAMNVGDVPNGEYTWTLTAETLAGTPLDFRASGSFTLVRETAPHDFNDNGSLDIIQRDSLGSLWRSDTTVYSGGTLEVASRQFIGRGWEIYDRIEAAGNLGGTAVGDLLARDKAGVLWLYQGNGRGGFATRVRVGGGWGIYDEIAAGSDLTNDGRADVVAADKSGGLWLYPGTGKAGTPFGARKKIGTGWGVYDELTAVGDIAGGRAGDLVARDRSGVLWQYLGKGDGTFAPRTRIGGGWNSYGWLIGAGDVTKDGRPDLLSGPARPSLGAEDPLYLYRSTGNWRAPLAPVQRSSVYNPGYAWDETA
ncbi:FG-GAP repeat domain-containing protein [Streptomyces sp. NPDC085460]|uniref:FG-GAP repeat domain-containing protein n=1 Tax=Streptomyces sp. NPDC085460 TaxID=3365723 RepID=UPI0037D8D14F